MTHSSYTRGRVIALRKQGYSLSAIAKRLELSVEFVHTVIKSDAPALARVAVRYWLEFSEPGRRLRTAEIVEFRPPGGKPTHKKRRSM